jgi:hypothetical protein
MILRLLNAQGIAGIAVGLALAILLVVQKVETGHWKKQSASFERLYRQEQAAFAVTTANYRAAADAARAADLADSARVAADQRAINERTADDFEIRLSAARANAAARAAAARLDSGGLRLDARAAADPRAGGSASMPGVPAGAAGVAQAAGQDRLSEPDALTATEQAIQLDELIKWVRAQAAVRPGEQAPRRN